MFVYPYLKSHGYLLYLDMVHPYPPLLTIILSIWFSIFGYSVPALQGITWLILAINDILIYLILLSITKNRIIGLLGLSSYIALQPFLEGNMLWFDIAVTIPILLGTLFALKVKPNSRIFLAALMFAAAALIKQTGGLFYLGFLAWLLIQKVKRNDFLIALLTPLILLIPLLFRLLQEGAVGGFISWVVYYPSTFWTSFPGYVQMNLNKGQMLLMGFLILPLFFFLYKIKKVKEEAYLLLLFLIIGLISIYPRFSYFHLQTALPFFALLYPIAIHKISFFKSIWFWLLGLAVCMIFIQRPLILREWGAQARFAENSEYLIAEKIKNQVPEGETIYLQGLYASQYVFSDLLPGKPWLDNFGWYYEAPGVQEWTLERWQQDPPKHIFMRGPYEYEPKFIKSWILENYSETGKLMDGIVHLEYKK